MGIMSNKQFIENLEAGIDVNSSFSVKYKHPTKKYKNGFMFVVGIADRTGESEIAYFGGTDERKVKEAYNTFERDDIIEVKNGKVAQYKDSTNITINEGIGKIVKMSEYDITDFVPETENDIEDMTTDLMQTIESVENPHLKTLLASFFSDSSFLENFKKAPAALYIHHAYIGGLLEHTLHVIELCKSISKVYNTLDKDLLLTGAILHDIGKIKEFVVTTNIKQTEDGMLRGHITLGEEMVLEKIRSISDFPETLRLKVAHIMLSHHGSNEYGSPKEPCFPEAVAIHYADEFDSRVDQYVKMKDNANTEDFRTYTKRLGSIYLK